MRIRLTFQSVINRSPMIIVGLSSITVVWIMFFLYAKLYKPLTQTDTIIMFRSEAALQLLDYKAYERLKTYQENRRNLKEIEVPSGLNPFTSQTNSVLPPNN